MGCPAAAEGSTRLLAKVPRPALAESRSLVRMQRIFPAIHPSLDVWSASAFLLL